MNAFRKVVALSALVAAGAPVSQAADPVSVEPSVIDMGEMPAGGSCTRRMTLVNLTSRVLPLAWVESDGDASLMMMSDFLRPKARVPGCVSLRAGAEPGDFVRDVVFVLGGVTNETVRLRLKGRVVESDPELAYSDAGFGALHERSPLSSDRSVVWRCTPQTEECLQALRGTNLISVLQSMSGVRSRMWKARSPLGAFCSEGIRFALRRLFVDGAGSDAERDGAFNRGVSIYTPCGDKEIDAAVDAYNRKVSDRRHAETMAKLKAEQDRRSKALHEKWAAEKRAKDEAWAKMLAQENAFREEREYMGVGLTGRQSSKAWQEYIQGEGRAFADEVHFKTNVFLPFLLKEFGVAKEKNARIRKTVTEFLEREFADLLCHGREAQLAVSNRATCAKVCLTAGKYGRAIGWAYKEWTDHKCTNPFVLAVAPYFNETRCWRLKGVKGPKAFVMTYELSEGSVPKGRAGLVPRFVRDSGDCDARRRHDAEYPGEATNSIVNLCKALEREGARPETWRCVMLLSLRVSGNSFTPRRERAMADALEQAKCAPFLVRLFREEPVYHYFDRLKSK